MVLPVQQSRGSAMEQQSGAAKEPREGGKLRSVQSEESALPKRRGLLHSPRSRLSDIPSDDRKQSTSAEPESARSAAASISSR